MKMCPRMKVLILLVAFVCDVTCLLAPIRGTLLSKYLHVSTTVAVSKVQLYSNIANFERTVVSQTNGTVAPAESLDAMRARAGILRTSIVKKQMELQELERQILCCSRNDDETIASKIFQSAKTFSASTNVLIRKLVRVQTREGPNNQKWNSVGQFVASQTQTGARIVTGLLANTTRLQHLVDPQTPSLVPHVPGILARLDRLESHVAPILERVLNNRQHLASVEPYLGEVLERLDDIEPHLPWILDNIDTLAPYTGLLLKHIDELLMYANDDEGSENSYKLAEQLLPYLEYYVSRLDLVG